MKVCRALWEAGIDVPLETCKKWLNWDVHGEVRLLQELADVEPRWIVVVYLNQLLQVVESPDELEEVIHRTANKPLAMVVALRKYYPETRDAQVAFELIGDEPDYGKASKGVVDFFLNYLRFEEGVDVDELVASLRKLVEREETVEDLLRLSGIDLLLKPEEFVERVGKAVDVLLKAREQGLSVEKIVERWDELANQGGDRFSYLEAAVKDVAAREINEAFWREMEKVLADKGVRISGRGSPSLVFDLFYLDLVNIEGSKVDVSPATEVLEDLAYFLRKVRPMAFYTAEEVEKVLKLMGVGRASDPDTLKKVGRVMSLLDRFSASLVFQSDIPVYDLVETSHRSPEEIARDIGTAVKEAHQEGLKGKVLFDYIQRKLSS